MRPFPFPVSVGLSIVLGASLGVVPVVAQDDSYQAALDSGNLAMLVPPRFADAEDFTTFTLGQSLPPAGFTDDETAAREELSALLADSGVTLDDAQAYSGLTVDGEQPFAFHAHRIPGIAAVDWFELVFRAHWSNGFDDPVRDIMEIGPKQVLTITSRGLGNSTWYYPQGEVLWHTSGDEPAIAREFFEGLATIDGPALSVDPAALVDGEPVATVGTADDPLSQIPEQILGTETTTQSMPAAALIEGASEDDADAVEAFATLLESLGGVDKATFISSQAFSDDGGVSIGGVSIEGADHADFAEALLEAIVLPAIDTPQVTETTLGGKPVLRVADDDSYSASATYVYGVGGTVWLLNGQEEWIAALLRTMP